MKKRNLTNISIIVGLCVLLAILICILTPAAAGLTLDSTNQYSKEDLINLMEKEQGVKQNAHTMAESARALGWNEEDVLIKDLQTKWYEADAKIQKYQGLLNDILAKEAAEAENAKWAEKEAEYPAATYIWKFMKEQGWNDYVCAGIMGNLMTEVGGQTLNIRYDASGNGYYGMCQWNRAYYQVWGADLSTQCNFLRDTIKYEFDTYGFKYQKGFNFNSFLNMTDAQQAALAFAKSYERCGSGSYGVRQSNAIKAYNYFVN